MRYSIDQYAKALAAAILEKKPGNEAVIQKNFHELLRRTAKKRARRRYLTSRDAYFGQKKEIGKLFLSRREN